MGVVNTKHETWNAAKRIGAEDFVREIAQTFGLSGLRVEPDDEEPVEWALPDDYEP